METRRMAHFLTDVAPLVNSEGNGMKSPSILVPDKVPAPSSLEADVEALDLGTPNQRGTLVLCFLALPGLMKLLLPLLPRHCGMHCDSMKTSL